MANFSMNGVGNWLHKNPLLASTIIGGGMTIGGGILAGKGQEGAAKAQQQSDNAATAAKMMGNGPLDVQKQRVQMELMRALLGGKLQAPMISAPEHLKSYQGSMGQMPVLPDESMSFLSKDAMAAAEQPYWNMVNKLSPGTINPGNLAAAGYGQSAYGPQGQATAGAVAGGTSPEEIFNSNFGAIQEAKQRTGDWEKAYQQVTGQAWPKGQHITIDQDGGHMAKDESKWKKIAKVGAMVAPIAAMPFTGGASAALIGAGAGAASSALNGGGLKGALMGGAMGAAGGALGGGGGKVPFSPGNLLKAVANPRAATQIASNFVPGPAGALMGMGANFLPGAKFGSGMPKMGPNGMPGPMNPNEGLGLPGAGEMLDAPPTRSSMPSLQGGANPRLAALQNSIGKGNTWGSVPYNPGPGKGLPPMFGNRRIPFPQQPNRTPPFFPQQQKAPWWGME